MATRTYYFMCSERIMFVTICGSAPDDAMSKYHFGFLATRLFSQSTSSTVNVTMAVRNGQLDLI